MQVIHCFKRVYNGKSGHVLSWVSKKVKDVKLKLSGMLRGCEFNQNTRYTSRFWNWHICNISKRAKCIKTKLSGNIEGAVRSIKRHNLRSGCQNGISAIFQERLTMLIWNYSVFLAGTKWGYLLYYPQNRNGSIKLVIKRSILFFKGQKCLKGTKLPRVLFFLKGLTNMSPNAIWTLIPWTRLVNYTSCPRSYSRKISHILFWVSV